MQARVQQKQRKLEKYLSWVQIHEKRIEFCCSILGILLCLRLCWIIYTSCESILDDRDLFQKVKETYWTSPSHGSLVYTALCYALVNIGCHLWDAYIVVFKNSQPIQETSREILFSKGGMILCLHYIFVKIWYIKLSERNGPHTETFIASSVGPITTKLIVFKNSELYSPCINSLYSATFWALIFMDLSICLMVLRILIHFWL